MGKGHVWRTQHTVHVCSLYYSLASMDIVVCCQRWHAGTNPRSLHGAALRLPLRDVLDACQHLAKYLDRARLDLEGGLRTWEVVQTGYTS